MRYQSPYKTNNSYLNSFGDKNGKIIANKDNTLILK